MNLDQTQSQAYANTSFAGVIEVQKGQNEVMEAIARLLGARPIGNAITVGGGGDLAGFGTQAGGDALLERTEIIADLNLNALGFSDAASILSLARDATPMHEQTTTHDSAVLGATLAAQSSMAATTVDQTASDAINAFADYYAQHA